VNALDARTAPPEVEDVALLPGDGESIPGVIDTPQGVPVIVTPELRDLVGASPDLPQGEVARRWAEQLVRDLPEADRELLRTRDRRTGLMITADPDGLRYTSVTTDVKGIRPLADVQYPTTCSVATNTSCLRRSTLYKPARISGFGTGYGAWSGTRSIHSRTSFSITYQFNGVWSTLYPKDSIHFGAPGLTVTAVNHSSF